MNPFLQRTRILYHRFAAWLRDAWRPPCAICNGPATLCEPCARSMQPQALPVSRARYCPECDVAFPQALASCPVCASAKSWILLDDLVRNRTRRQRCREALKLLKGGAR